MNDLPLHPIVVHLPLVLAFLVPGVVLAILVGRTRGPLRRRSWWMAVAGGVLLAGGSVAAVQSGEQDEERVEAVVDGAAIERHEEAAEAFMWGSVVLLALLLSIPLVKASKLELLMGTLAVVGGIALAISAIQVGHSGGELVYRNGAATAYSGGGHQTARDLDHEEHERGRH